MAGLVDLTGFLSPLIERLADFIPDPAEKAKAMAAAQTEMLNFVTTQQTGQLEVDKAEATNSNLFVSGWRPAIGWVCGAGLGWTFLVGPVATYVLTIVAPQVHLPVIPTDGLMELVFAMLGLGGMRTFEKVQGVAASRPLGK
jgi:hypothetical protein